MRLRTTALGLGAAAALALSTLAVGTATAAGYDGATAAPNGVKASLGGGTAGVGTDAVSAKKGKCGTAFGTPIDDGIISGGGGNDVAGAADISCPKKKKARTIKSVTVQGYFGDPTTTNFDVTVYADKAGEPDDGKIVCTSSGAGTPTGSAYPVADTTVIKLASKCVAKKGTNWVSVQSTGGSAWYWRTQTTAGGSFEGDWADTNNVFGTGCTTYQNGRDMESCIFGGDQGQNDFMLLLK